MSIRTSFRTSNRQQSGCSLGNCIGQGHKNPEKPAYKHRKSSLKGLAGDKSAENAWKIKTDQFLENIDKKYSFVRIVCNGVRIMTIFSHMSVDSIGLRVL
jgi:hypothetical protein